VRVFIHLLFALILSGCETQSSVRPASMVPDVSRTAAGPIEGKVLSIAAVQDGTKSESGSANGVRIDAESFREALSSALVKARFSRPASIGGDADYELRAHLASQQALASGYLAFTSHLLVSYRLIERRTAQEVWHQSIYSTFRAQESTSMGAIPKARQAALEGAVRENLELLVTKLDDVVRASGGEVH
jgi:hypothetical protein